ncbi:SDR family oxidoreductase [Portibacter marinus]|uniref:SDR family oxidoreductase n=1 Tax=Portibacter marinus TaxID=2898660 RepID=UPI001F3B7B70|nr:SDR family oxidoreductase [Portibacter marinus]
MKVLLTGATGYIGRRLIPLLIEQDHEIVCALRDRERITLNSSEAKSGKISFVECDFLEPDTMFALPKDIDIAYYLIHSMSTSSSKFDKMEREMAENFKSYLNSTNCRQCIYLSGIVNDDELSTHLMSRLQTEKILRSSEVPVTVLRAAIIIGSGSASFEIIRDLSEKLPVMIAPKWLKTLCQPISIRDVLSYLTGVINKEATFDQSFDIGGPDVLSYKDMLLGYAKVRDLKRWIISVPVFSPKISSYWLYFVTSTSYTLAKSLVSSMKNEVVASPNDLHEMVSVENIGYEKSIKLALGKIKQNSVVSSWKDALSSGKVDSDLMDYIEVPTEAVLMDERKFPFDASRLDEVMMNLWSIGGRNGWYYGDFLWKIRGFLDKLVGGVGLRRGRRSSVDLVAGDPLDFWRVLVADQEKGRLLLYAEMRLPGDAWLEFCVDKKNADTYYLQQKATFRPKGLLGRIYWYSVLPLHSLVFPGMAKGIIRGSKSQPVVDL